MLGDKGDKLKGNESQTGSTTAAAAKFKSKKSPYERGFPRIQIPSGLLDFGFFVDNVLTNYGIKLFDLHFLRHVTLVLVGSVEVTSLGA